MELYLKHRPRKFSEVVGQKEVVSVLKELGKRGEIPHAMLFTGPSGVGKTTIARIIRHKLKCADVDYLELNAADFRGIDTIRDISRQCGSAPLGGPCRVFLIDEVHQLTSAAQDSFLKLLEDTPKHVYFLLATTRPEQLKQTIITRCTVFKCKELSRDEIGELVRRIAKKEGKQLDDEVVEKIAANCQGSARQALVFLHAVIGLESPSDQIAAIEQGHVAEQAIQLARKLINPRTGWPEVADVLKKIDDDPESVRWLILGYCRTVLLGGGSNARRAAMIIEEFRDNLYDSKQAGLALCCWNVITGGQ